MDKANFAAAQALAEAAIGFAPARPGDGTRRAVERIQAHIERQGPVQTHPETRQQRRARERALIKRSGRHAR